MASNGHYKIYVKGFRKIGRTLYNLAVLESPDQDWKYFNGEISNEQNQLVYQLNINNDQSSSLGMNGDIELLNSMNMMKT